MNGSFESGAGNFIFTNNSTEIALDASMVGQWVCRQSNEDHNMDLAGVRDLVAGENGAISMMFQSTGKRGLVQVIDVSQVDVNGMQLIFSSAFAAPGREAETSSDMATYQVIGFNDFTNITVDLGGEYQFMAGSYDSVIPQRAIADSELSGSTFTVFNEHVVLGGNYNYLAVLVGGVAGVSDLDTQYVAVDGVALRLSFEEVFHLKLHRRGEWRVAGQCFASGICRTLRLRNHGRARCWLLLRRLERFEHRESAHRCQCDR